MKQKVNKLRYSIWNKIFLEICISTLSGNPQNIQIWLASPPPQSLPLFLPLPFLFFCFLPPLYFLSFSFLPFHSPFLIFPCCLYIPSFCPIPLPLLFVSPFCHLHLPFFSTFPLKGEWILTFTWFCSGSAMLTVFSSI